MDYQPTAQVEKQKEVPKQQSKKKADIHQESSGPSSPNIVTGDHSTVNIQMPVASQPRFREKVDSVRFHFGDNLLHCSIKELLEGRTVTAVRFGKTGTVSVHLEGGVVYVDASIAGGGGLPPIEIKHNEFERPRLGWDRNSDESALEFVNTNQNALFQLIYTSDFDIHLRGVFPIGNGALVITDGTSSMVNPAGSILPYLPKTIFKYPSSVHPGQPAEFLIRLFRPFSPVPLAARMVAACG